MALLYWSGLDRPVWMIICQFQIKFISFPRSTYLTLAIHVRPTYLTLPMHMLAMLLWFCHLSFFSWCTPSTCSQVWAYLQLFYGAKALPYALRCNLLSIDYVNYLCFPLQHEYSVSQINFKKIKSLCVHQNAWRSHCSLDEILTSRS